jgi:hypothetical protein
MPAPARFDSRPQIPLHPGSERAYGMPNLILVHQESKQERGDYEAIARDLRARIPDIAVFIVDTKDTR